MTVALKGWSMDRKDPMSKLSGTEDMGTYYRG
jgi:hypothetical protein